MPRVDDDSGTQILPGFRKDSEHQAVHADDDRGHCTLINVARAKQRRREKHADRSAARSGNPITATTERARRRKSVWTGPSYSFKLLNWRFQPRFDRSVRHRSPRLCLLRADSLTTHAARARTRKKRLVRPKTGGGGREIHRERSYLCASCPFGQSIFVCVVGDDGIRPATIQRRHTGACGRSHSRW
jgi:hypothetical protein